jgi:selenide,water dikinase
LTGSQWKTGSEIQKQIIVGNRGPNCGFRTHARDAHGHPGTTRRNAQNACRGGGHTIDSVEPIYGLVALGLVHPNRVKRNASAQLGDKLILGKPLGIGILSAALKKNQLDAAGYAQMIAVTTQLNTPGPALAGLPGVHVMTDVTGFALAGHALEIARGGNCTVEIDWARVPLLSGVRQLAQAGNITGASGRNWVAYGAEVGLPQGFSAVDQALLTDPQTSGGLLVSCAPDAVDAVLAVFKQLGFVQACEIGEITRATGEAKLVLR